VDDRDAPKEEVTRSVREAMWQPLLLESVPNQTARRKGCVVGAQGDDPLVVTAAAAVDLDVPDGQDSAKPRAVRHAARNAATVCCQMAMPFGEALKKSDWPRA
jgi:hypothetical protein